MRKIIGNRLFLCLIFSCGLVNLLINNWSISLWDQDEAAYAGFAHNMLHTGNWLVPDFLWSALHRKPPLHFWVIASSFLSFGENEFAVRFPSTLAVIFTLLAFYFLGKSVFGKERVLAACVIMCCSLLLPNLGKIALTDALLVFLETVAVLAIFNYIKQPHWKWAFLIWLSVSLGVLVKGPPIVILTTLLITLLLLFYPVRSHLIRLQTWLVIPLALVPLLIWGRMAWLATGGEYIRWMIDWYILKRISGGTVFGQWGPPGYFLFVFMLAFLPWVMFLPKALVDTWNKFWSFPRDSFTLLVSLWLISGWFVYEIMPSKLPAYALGAYPAVALILAQQTLEVKPEDWQRKKILQFGLYLFWGLAALLTISLITAGFVLFNDLAIILIIVFVGITWLILAIISGSKFLMGDSERGFNLTILNALLFLFLSWSLIVPSFEQLRSTPKKIAATIESNTTPETQVIFAAQFDLPSLAFYVARKRRKFMAINSGELEKLDNFLNQEYVIMVESEKLDSLLEYLKDNHQSIAEIQTIAGWLGQIGKQSESKLVYNQFPAK